MLFILSFLEPPHWCRDSNLQIVEENLKDLDNYGDCEIILDARGTTIDGQKNQQYYPNWNMMYLTVSQSKSIEMMCIFVIFFYLLLKLGDDGFKLRLFLYPGYKRWVHSSQITILLCLVIGHVFERTTLHPFFRMMMLGSFLRNFQKELLTMMKMVGFGCRILWTIHS